MKRALTTDEAARPSTYAEIVGGSRIWSSHFVRVITGARHPSSVRSRMANAELSLDEELRRRHILRRARTRRLRNLTIKLDPVQIQTLWKLAIRRSVPYQTSTRHQFHRPE